MYRFPNPPFPFFLPLFALRLLDWQDNLLLLLSFLLPITESSNERGSAAYVFPFFPFCRLSSPDPPPLLLFSVDLEKMGEIGGAFPLPPISYLFPQPPAPWLPLFFFLFSFLSPAKGWEND